VKPSICRSAARSSGNPLNMRSSPQLALALVLFPCLLFEGCGAYFVGFVSNPGGNQTISGTISTVQLSFVQDITGETIVLTAVTFLNSGAATTLNFCGNQQEKFPVGDDVRADFSTGVLCSTLLAVVVVT
jgi:hypothetical protein